MNEVVIDEQKVVKAVSEGMDEFLKVFTDAIYETIDGNLTAESIQKLNASQITLVAYDILRAEVMDGGFVQLIHNGYGGFIFLNPFAKAVRLWGLKDLQDLIYDARKLYDKYHQEIEKECSDEDFMAMFEKYEEFDNLDDRFVEKEEEYTDSIAKYVDQNIDIFAKIEKI
jgi:hypothetical protein